MEPKVALTTAPTAKLLWAEMLQMQKRNIKIRDSVLLLEVLMVNEKYLPGNSHADVIWQRYDGANCYGEFDIGAGVLVFSVNISSYQGNYH